MEDAFKIVALGEAHEPSSQGAKAVGLAFLEEEGFRVPRGFVLSRELTEAILAQNGLVGDVGDLLAGLGEGNVRETAGGLMALTASLRLPAELTQDIFAKLQPGLLYAVRCSPVLKELDDASFAGQYPSFLNTLPQDIPQRVTDCIRSQWQERSLSGLCQLGLDPGALGMAVIIQEMVPADLAGVAFSVDPDTGNDHTIVFDTVQGLGDALVSKRGAAQRSRYNWYQDKAYPAGESPLLDQGRLRVLGKRILKIQKLCGYPVAVEFAIARNRNYALQVRPLTKIHHSALKDQWTTAGFADIGVSAGACKAFMGSLFEYAWETQLKRFLLESDILEEKELRQLSQILYARPYWNMSLVKEAMAKVPGFREREFDAAFGIRAGYLGEGRVTQITPANALKLASVALKQRASLKERQDKAKRLSGELLEGYETMLAALPGISGEELKGAWIRLVRDLYLKSEGAYLGQIFSLTMVQNLSREAVQNYVDGDGYLRLMSGLTNISRLRPFDELWTLSRSLQGDAAALEFWLETDPLELLRLLRDDSQEAHGLTSMRALVNQYQYLSDGERDVSWPNYGEDPTALIQALRDFLSLSSEFSPETHQQRLRQDYLDTLEKLAQEHGQSRAAKVREKVERIRAMLWWREEFRDLSSRYYHLIRLYTLKLSEELQAAGLLKEASDVWHLSFRDIMDLLDGRRGVEKIASYVKRNRNYYKSFRNFQSEKELGAGYFPLEAKLPAQLLARGLPGSPGSVQGRARVLEGRSGLGDIVQGDILVTKSTDTGWTSKFPLLGGVITEFGGAQCHAAVVSREYGIPCITGVSDGMNIIRDGDNISMNGATGEIRREEALFAGE